MEGINAIPGLQVRGEPDMSVLAFGSDEIDSYAVCDAMIERGWDLERLQKPPNLHLVVTPAHSAAVDPFLSDLREATQEAADKGPATEGAAAMYGMLNALPDRGQVHNVILDFIDGMTRLEESQ